MAIVIVIVAGMLLFQRAEHRQTTSMRATDGEIAGLRRETVDLGRSLEAVQKDQAKKLVEHENELIRIGNRGR